MKQDHNSFYQYLIIGQGLAGSLLAWNLLLRGRSVLLLDNNHASSSSLVAAGLVNPMAGMRFNLPARIDHWLDAANQTYGALERESGLTLHHAIPMVRLFRSVEQVRFWQRQANSERATAYLGERFGPNESGQPVIAPFGGFFQKRTGYVNLPALLQYLSDRFRKAGRLIQHQVNHDQIEVLPDEVRWNGVRAGQLIFCEGYQCQHNPWFRQLPFTPDKGEFLTLDGGKQPDKIINGAHMAVPLAQGGIRFGATHNHSVQNNEPTGAGRNQLLAGMEKLLIHTEGMEITAHHAGVRPATQDRHPFLGTHAVHSNLHLFNGFGAKGTLTIPWYAQQFTAYLEQGKPLPDEADIKRYIPNTADN